ncbi:MAG: hypothetical protein JWP31_2479 [Aeromicrobium sp.]|nr:hypothetical protein [Aeromicrobium sp.]
MATPVSADHDLEQRILVMLGSRADTSTICPSEVAREVRPDDWRPLMEPVREAARRLVEQGRVEITQHGVAVDPAAVRGPIRIRLSGAGTQE